MRRHLAVGSSPKLPSSGVVFSILLASIVLGAAETSVAAGRRVVIEFSGGQDDTATPNSGDSWIFDVAPCSDPSSSDGAVCTVALADNLSSVAINLGFTIQIGSSDYSSVFIHENGLVTFGAAYNDANGFTAAADLAALETLVGGPFIAPYYANLVLQGPGPITDTFDSSAAYFRASADPVEPYHPNAEDDPVDERVPAFAVTWRDVNFPVLTQLVLYSADDGSGDFSLRLRYGDEADQTYTGLAGFSLHTGLNSDRVTVANPLGGGDLPGGADLYFEFEDGHLAGAQPPDSDGDGVPDAEDNCPTIGNADQADLDGDDIGDICDADRDGDSVPDSIDNCPLVSNPSQADGNRNGIGDACDTTSTRCYVDGDADIDAKDILAILRAVPRKASGPTDPRDADGNGKILLRDALICTLQCTRRYCAL